MLSRFEIFQLLFDVVAITDNLEPEMPQTHISKLDELRAVFEIYDIEVVRERRPRSSELLKAEEGREYGNLKRHISSLVNDYVILARQSNKKRVVE